MSQQGGWGGPPQGGGGQPQGGNWQPGGYPQQGAPQQGGGWQQGAPQQGGYPQQGAPQPGAYPPQGGGYPPRGTGQQGQPPRPGGYPPSGFQPTGTPQPKGGSGAKIIGIVVGALVVLGLLGALISVIVKPKGPTDPVGPTPSVTMATPTRPASTGPATSTPASSTPATTKPATTAPSTPPPAGGAILVGQGISITPVAGWAVVKQEADFVVLQNGKAVMLAETGKVKTGTTGSQLVESYLTSIGKDQTNVKRGQTTTVDLDPAVSVAKAVQVGTTTGSGGSQTLAFGALGSVRVADGVAFVGTLAWPASEDVTAYNADYTKMVSSMLVSQLGK